MSNPLGVGVAERAEAESALLKQYKVLKNAVKVIEKQKKIVDRLNGRHKFKYKVTKIPYKTYTKGKRKVQTDLLSKLPAEIGANIWKLLPLDADRAALALTCKSHAETYEVLKEKRVASTLKFLLPRPSNVTKTHRLQMLVRLTTWMPVKYRLCYKCNQYIDKKGPDNEGTWGGDSLAVAEFLATLSAVKRGPRCPLCRAADKFELGQHKKEFKEYKAMAESIRTKIFG